MSEYNVACMVIENPLSQNERETLERALDKYFDYETNIEDVQTSEKANYDYDLTLTQWRSKPSKRTVNCSVKWHEDANDWEVMVDSKSGWLS